MKQVESNLGVLVRVHPRVEELVKIVAKRLGLYPSSVRHVAILLGLLEIERNGFPVWNDKEFLDFLMQVEKVIRSGEKEG